MNFLRDSIERKLSELLGRGVTFAQLNVSPLSGQVEAEGITVAGDEPDKSLLTVQRISAKVAVAKALAGQIVIKSLVIEGFTLNLTRRADGSLNIPRRGKQPITNSEKAKNDWQLEAQSVRLINGRVNFEDQRGQARYIASAEQITGELKQSAGQMDFNFSVRSIGRRDVAVELGPLELSGQISDADCIKQLAGSPIEAQLKFADGFRATVNSPAINKRRAVLDLRGQVDIAKWLAAIPSTIVAPHALSTWKFNEPIEATARIDIDAEQGIRIQEIDLRSRGITIPLNQVFALRK